MTRELTRILSNCLNPDPAIKGYGCEPQSVGLMIFGCLEDSEESFGGSSNSDNSDSYRDLVDEQDEQEDDDLNSCNAGENKSFWEAQDQLLQATLCRSSSIESKIRQATKEAIKELNMMCNICVCRKPVAEVCRNCLKREISLYLQNRGYNCAICKSKWMSSKDIPAGEHTYLEVVDSSNSKKGEIRVIIELNFRAEFEMAKAGEEYNVLTSRLPEVFVGKIERLRALIKILCSASKKCMKDKKMHMAPWRKQKYMQAKWDGARELNAPPVPVIPSGHFDRRLPRQRTSMLSFDLLETLPALHCQAIRVV